MKKFISLLLCCYAINCLAQNEYYTTDGKDRLMASEIEEIKLGLQEKTTKALGKATHVTVVKEEKLVIKDSILFKVKFNITDTKNQNKKEPVISVGDVLPSFSLSSLDEKLLKLDDFKGKPTLVNFWFTGCAPCIEEMPILNKMAERFKDKINFIAITFEPSERVKRFLSRKKFDFIHLVDANEYIKSLGINSFPKNLFLDAQGKILLIKGGIPYKMNAKGELIIGENEQFNDILEKMVQQKN